MKYGLFASTLHILFMSASSMSVTSEDILAAIDRNRDFNTVTYTATMEIHIGGAVRSKTMKTQAIGDRKALMEFTNPQDHGVKFLKIAKELWIYFPSEQDIVKISGHMLKEGMMGSDVSYEDAMESDAVLEKYSATLIGEDAVEGKPCYVMMLEAKVKDAPYYRRKMWVDRDMMLPVKEELYAKSGKLLKETKVLETKRIGARLFPVKVEMVNKLRKDTKTIFSMSDIVFDVKLNDNIFSLQNLQR